MRGPDEMTQDTAMSEQRMVPRAYEINGEQADAAHFVARAVILHVQWWWKPVPAAARPGCW